MFFFTKDGNMAGFVCPASDEVLARFPNNECGLEQIRKADPETCLLYSNSHEYQNTILQCYARECGVFNVSLLVVCILLGGFTGLILLCLINGCSCEPPGALKFHARREAEKVRDEAGDIYDQVAGNSPTDSDDQDDTLDLTDGIDEGDEGIILQYVVKYLCHRAEKIHFERRKNLAYVYVVFTFMKKLGLKLIIVVPLLATKNFISVAPYFLDVLVLVYFWMQQKYFPGSLYNELHTLATGRKYQKVALHAAPDLNKSFNSN